MTRPGSRRRVLVADQPSAGGGIVVTERGEDDMRWEHGLIVEYERCPLTADQRLGQCRRDDEAAAVQVDYDRAVGSFIDRPRQDWLAYFTGNDEAGPVGVIDGDGCCQKVKRADRPTIGQVLPMFQYSRGCRREKAVDLKSTRSHDF